MLLHASRISFLGNPNVTRYNIYSLRSSNRSGAVRRWGEDHRLSSRLASFHHFGFDATSISQTVMGSLARIKVPRLQSCLGGAWFGFVGELGYFCHIGLHGRWVCLLFSVGMAPWAPSACYGDASVVACPDQGVAPANMLGVLANLRRAPTVYRCSDLSYLLQAILYVQRQYFLREHLRRVSSSGMVHMHHAFTRCHIRPKARPNVMKVKPIGHQCPNLRVKQSLKRI
jgi:hypothetical protein